MNIPKNVLEAIGKLDAADQETVKSYIMQLDPATSQATADESEKESEQQQQQKEEEDDEPASSTSGDLPQYEQGEDYEKAASHKMKASELVSSGDFTGALDEYNHAVVSAPPSALLLASRADVLLHLKRYQDAVRDCNQALETNPDSAKALRIRGRALKELKDYEGSRRDLAASQQIDYDDEAAKDLKFVMDKVNEMEKEHVKKKLEEEERMKKKVEDLKRAREQAKKEAEEEKSREPFAAGGMGGMGGMPGMADILGDPEIAAGLQNPKVMSALTSMMTNPDPSKITQLMMDPEVGPIMQKLMSKLGPTMGGGMPGGMGGFGGSHRDSSAKDGDGDDDDLPDLDDIPNL